VQIKIEYIVAERIKSP